MSLWVQLPPYLKKKLKGEVPQGRFFFLQGYLVQFQSFLAVTVH